MYFLYKNNLSFCVRIGLWVLCSWAFVCAQPDSVSCSLKLRGQLLGAHSREPIPYAEVYLMELQKGFVSDGEGRFLLRGLCVGTYRVQLRHLSYQDKEISLFLRHALDTLWYLEEDVLLLEEIEVKDHKNETLLPEGRLSRAEIRNSSGKSIGEALEQIPGLRAAKRGNSLARPIIDGLKGERVVILNNDIAQEDQQWAADHAPSIDLLNMAEVSILHGPGLLRYSTGALGGVVILRPSKLPYEKKKISAEALSHYSSNGRRMEASLQLARGFSLSKPLSLAVLATGSFKRGGDLQSPNYALSNTGIQEASTALHLGLRYKHWIQELQYSLFSNKLGILRSSHTGSIGDLKEAIERSRPLYIFPFSYAISTPYQRSWHELWKAKSLLQLNKQQRIELILAYQRNRRQEFEARRGGRSAIPSTHLRLHSYDLNLFWEMHYLQDKMLTQAGISIRSQTNFNVPGTGRKPFLPDYTEQSFAWFAVQSLFLGKSSLEASLRYDHTQQQAYVSKHFLPRHRMHVISAMVGYNRPLGKGWDLHFHAGLGQRIPGIHERYSQGVHHSSLAIEEGDPGLRNETSLKNEMHLHQHSSSWEAEGRLYHQEIDGFIYGATLPEPRLTIRGAFPVRQYRQHNASLRGGEVIFRYKGLKWMQYSAEFSWIRGRNRSLKQPLIGIPSDRLQQKLHLNWHVLRTPIAASLTHQFVAQQHLYPQDLDLSPPPAAYHLLGVAASLGPWSRTCTLQAQIGAENLLNTVYRDYLNYFRYFADEPGPNIWLRITYLF